MPRFNSSYEKKKKKKTRKRSREDDEDNLGHTEPSTKEIPSSSSEEEEHNMEVTQPLTTDISSEEEKGEGKLSSEELKAVEDSFYLSLKLLDDVSRIICKRDRDPSREKDREWNQYIKSSQFYQITKVRVKDKNCKTLEGYESLEEDTESTQSLSSEEEDNLECAQPLAEKEDKMEGMEEEASAEEEDKSESPEEVASSEEEDNSESPKEGTSSEEDVHVRGFCRPVVKLPVVFGRYSSGTAADRIPYHLYLLVKEAVDIMTTFPDWHNNTNHAKELRMVEGKIWFFCTYLHCHLPHGWKYDRDAASDDVSSYDPARKPIYNMDGFTPITKFDDYRDIEYDAASKLSRQDMLQVMRVIHSRKTPKYWTMAPEDLAFYCRLCSCVGINYARLEDASEDDVCLMNVGSFSVFDGCYI